MKKGTGHIKPLKHSKTQVMLLQHVPNRIIWFDYGVSVQIQIQVFLMQYESVGIFNYNHSGKMFSCVQKFGPINNNCFKFISVYAIYVKRY